MFLVVSLERDLHLPAAKQAIARNCVRIIVIFKEEHKAPRGHSNKHIPPFVGFITKNNIQIHILS